MKDELDDLKAMWQKAKVSTESIIAVEASTLITLGVAKKKSMLAAHYANALILSVLLIVLIVFFHYIISFQNLLSHIGSNLMIGGIALRIGIEIFSVFCSRHINISDTAALSLENSISFYQFRKRTHGSVTYLIFGFYFVGFYMLTPEFLQYNSLPMVILMDTSALLIAFILIKVISKGIRKELQDLEKIVELQKSLTKEEAIN